MAELRSHLKSETPILGNYSDIVKDRTATLRCFRTGQRRSFNSVTNYSNRMVVFGLARKLARNSTSTLSDHRPDWWAGKRSAAVDGLPEEGIRISNRGLHNKRRQVPSLFNCSWHLLLANLGYTRTTADGGDQPSAYNNCQRKYDLLVRWLH